MDRLTYRNPDLVNAVLELLEQSDTNTPIEDLLDQGRLLAINPKTVRNLLAELQDFGAIRPIGAVNYRLTDLGRAWIRQDFTLLPNLEPLELDDGTHHPRLKAWAYPEIHPTPSEDPTPPSDYHLEPTPTTPRQHPTTPRP